MFRKILEDGELQVTEVHASFALPHLSSNPGPLRTSPATGVPNEDLGLINQSALSLSPPSQSREKVGIKNSSDGPMVRH